MGHSTVEEGCAQQRHPFLPFPPRSRACHNLLRHRYHVAGAQERGRGDPLKWFQPMLLSWGLGLVAPTPSLLTKLLLANQ